MVGDILQPTHLLFVLVVALLVLGPKRLPEVGRTLGSGMRDFRQAISGESNDHHDHHEPEQVHRVETEPESDVWVHTESATEPTDFASDSAEDSTSSTARTPEPHAATPEPAMSEPAAGQSEHSAAESETQRPS